MRIPFPGEVIEKDGALCLVLGPTADGHGQRVVDLSNDIIELSNGGLDRGTGGLLSLEEALRRLSIRKV